jgi:hypothetical protein
MEIKSEQDFPRLREKISHWRQRFPLFYHDVSRIESIIETHIQNYSIALVFYRQTKNQRYLSDAEKELSAINAVMTLVEKMELMSLLSR